MKTEIDSKNGIAKVSAKGDIEAKKVSDDKEAKAKTKADTKENESANSLIVSAEIVKALSEIDTEANLKRAEKKNASVYNFAVVRSSDTFKDYSHSSNTTLRGKLRSKQDAICSTILHTAKENDQSALLSALKDLKAFNLFLNDSKIFCNNKRENKALLQTAYNIYHSNADKV